MGAAAVGAGVTAAVMKNKDQEKQAAVGLLVESGVDFDSAVQMVEKKASELEKAAFVGLATGYMAAKKGDKVGGTLLGGGIGGEVVGARAGATLGAKLGGGKGALIGALTGDAIGGHYGGKLYSHLKHIGSHEIEKKAAVGLLIEQGVDFDTAVALVSQKAAELY